MAYDPEKHHRQSIRLDGYDYSQNGAYFVTLCTEGHKCLFGNIENDKMILNDFGQIVHDEWIKSANIRPNISLDAFVIMPNHLHGIVIIQTPVRINYSSMQNNVQEEGVCNTPQTKEGVCNTPLLHSPSQTIGAILRGYKSTVTRRINESRCASEVILWQRNYYEHIISNKTSLNQIRYYIAQNPAKWESDKENPDVINFAE